MTPLDGAAQSAGLRGRDLITIEDLSAAEIIRLAADAIATKAAIRDGIAPARSLAGKHIALVFMQPSARTRAAFSIAAADLGAHPHVMGADELRLGKGESVRDIARVFSRMFAGIAIRAADTALVAEIAFHADVPVWNAMTNEDHPTQALADIMTIRESGLVAGSRIAFVGHGRGNVCTSLARAAARVGIHVSIVTPPGREPDPALLERLNRAQGHQIVSTTTDPAKGLLGAQAVYADMWVNMCDLGHQTGGDLASEASLFTPYRITDDFMRLTMQRQAIFLHCMPAQHTLETEFARAHPNLLDTDDDVFEGPRSRVIDQAENRLHAIRALMAATAA